MDFACNICKKEFKTYNGRWKHIKNTHGNNDEHVMSTGIHTMSTTNVPEKEDKKYTCSKCHKEYNNKTSKYRHQKVCIVTKNIYETKIEILEKKMEKLEKKTAKKVINNINNGTINNIVINKVGDENLLDLNDKEVTTIFNKELEGVITFIELLNFNERLPNNHSYCTTSLESKFLSTYNNESKTVEKDRKKYFFDKLITTTIDRLEILYKSNKKKFSSEKKKQIEENITNLKSLKNYDFNNKIVKEIMNKMNLLSYNKRAIVQKTWYNDSSDSEDDFQKDLEKNETREEMRMKHEKRMLKYNIESTSILSDSDDETNYLEYFAND
jgi:hypothetical protein